MARSNPDTYSRVPVFAKILKLLIAELDNRIEAEAMNGGQQAFGKDANHDGEDEDEEGDEWDDLEDELDGGSPNMVSSNALY